MSYTRPAAAALVPGPTPALAPWLAARLRRAVASGRDIDVMNVLMAAAMAGMLAGRFSPVPDDLWRITFAVAAAWFGAHTFRNWRRRAGAGQHVTHLLSCGGMLVMLAAPGAGRGLAGPMSGTGPALLPVLAAGFAGALAVTAVLVTDKLAATATVPGPSGSGRLGRRRRPPGHRPPGHRLSPAAILLPDRHGPGHGLHADPDAVQPAA